MAAGYAALDSNANNAFDVDRPAGYDATYPSAGVWGGTVSAIKCAAGWYDDAASTFVAPSGFTQPGGAAKRVGSHSNIIVGELCYKMSTASEPASYNGSGTGESDYDEMIAVIINGVDTSDPWDTVNSSSGQGTTVTWPGVSPARADSLGVAVHFGYNNPAGNISGTPTSTERLNAFDGVNDVYTIPMGTSDTADRTATKTSDTWVALWAIFQPPGGGGGGTPAARRTLLGVGRRELSRAERQWILDGRPYVAAVSYSRRMRTRAGWRRETGSFARVGNGWQGERASFAMTCDGWVRESGSGLYLPRAA
jgi:hypothetical protein